MNNWCILGFEVEVLYFGESPRGIFRVPRQTLRLAVRPGDGGPASELVLLGLEKWVVHPRKLGWTSKYCSSVDMLVYHVYQVAMLSFGWPLHCLFIYSKAGYGLAQTHKPLDPCVTIVFLSDPWTEWDAHWSERWLLNLCWLMIHGIYHGI